MAEVKKVDFNDPVPLTEEEDEETLAAIDRGIKAADEGRVVSSEEVRSPENDSRVDFKIRIAQAAIVDFEAVMAWSWTHHPGTRERFAASLLNR
jgi:hypothetical protein